MTSFNNSHGSTCIAAPHNKQSQRTVKDKVPRQVRQRAAAELRL
jgi:hypothetical protein